MNEVIPMTIAPRVRQVEVSRLPDGTNHVTVKIDTRGIATGIDTIEIAGSFAVVREWIGELGLAVGQAELEYFASLDQAAAQ